MKKTLIINGSPRKNGETAQLTRWISERLDGEVKEIFAYEAQVSPCVDCRYCFEHPRCCVQDEMQEIYQWIEECDNILLASPIYFSELTGTFLSLMSRFQPYFCSRILRNEAPTMRAKTAAVVVMFGGAPRDLKKPYDTACGLLDLINCRKVLPIVFGDHTDEIPAMEQRKTLEGAEAIVEAFNMNRIDKNN